jgi:hypothetical protein
MAEWPQAGGPDGSWTTKERAPHRWSVAENRNILFKTELPETGQSGIAKYGDRLYFTTMEPLRNARARKDGGNVTGHAADANTGELLWSIDLPAKEESPYAYGFSDSSTPTPVTNGTHVWFTNSSGHIVCCTADGSVVWRRTWDPTTGRPFNKQYEPILHGNTLVSVEPRDLRDPRRQADAWNHLRGIDAKTGKTLWVSDDGLTHYNTPVLGKTHTGQPAVMIGRGGHHDVPEGPSGLSLVSLAKGSEGKTIWKADIPGKALYNMHWNRDRAYWLDEDTGTHRVLDSRTGKEIAVHKLGENATVRSYDKASKRYLTEQNMNIKAKGFRVFPAWFSNIVVGDWHWFLCFSSIRAEYGGGPVGPLYSVGRVNTKTGATEYLELPTAPGVYGTNVEARTINSRGIDVASDTRSKRDGWYWCFIGSPVVAGGAIYWTMMNGTTYVINGNVRTLDERAILGVNDLGPVGGTWSLNTPTPVDGKLYHRTMTQLICIG